MLQLMPVDILVSEPAEQSQISPAERETAMEVISSFVAVTIIFFQPQIEKLEFNGTVDPALEVIVLRD